LHAKERTGCAKGWNIEMESSGKIGLNFEVHSTTLSHSEMSSTGRDFPPSCLSLTVTYCTHTEARS
jgi:hypothetical protein